VLSTFTLNVIFLILLIILKYWKNRIINNNGTNQNGYFVTKKNDTSTTYNLLT
jgi:hypothetical protein